MGHCCSDLSLQDTPEFALLVHVLCECCPLACVPFHHRCNLPIWKPLCVSLSWETRLEQGQAVTAFCLSSSPKVFMTSVSRDFSGLSIPESAVISPLLY